MIAASKKELLNGGALILTANLPTFCNDHLISNTKRVLAWNKYLQWEQILAYVWVKNSDVYIWENENSSAIKIHLHSCDYFSNRNPFSGAT